LHCPHARLRLHPRLRPQRHALHRRHHRPVATSVRAQRGPRRGFTARYGVKRLVYCEEFERIDAAIAREKHLKRWRRAWKIDLIEAANPEWRDLTEFWVA